MSNKDTSNKNILNILNLMYDNKVMCTNGLFHAYSKNHEEIYIYRDTREIDKRCHYNTIVVLDKIVVAYMVNVVYKPYVILNKFSLKHLYTTEKKLQYVNGLIYEQGINPQDRCKIFSSSGKFLLDLKHIISIDNIYQSIYHIKVLDMFEDKVVKFDTTNNVFLDLTKDKHYVISDNKDGKIELQSMIGGKYTYDFKTNICKNLFTGTYERADSVWTI